MNPGLASAFGWTAASIRTLNQSSGSICTANKTAGRGDRSASGSISSAAETPSEMRGAPERTGASVAPAAFGAGSAMDSTRAATTLGLTSHSVRRR